MRTKAIRSWILKGAPPLIHIIMRGLHHTVRWKEINNDLSESFWTAGRCAIFSFWHGRIFMTPFFYKGRGLRILISRHADGELIFRVMRRFGFEGIRGSTQRKGTEAFLELIRSCREGFDIAITPDGPRGPKYIVQKGIIELAGRTGLPIVPLSYSTQHRFFCSSWDDFLIPRPFTRGVIIFGKPLWVTPNAGTDQKEADRRELQKRLRRLTEAADVFFER